MSTSRNPSEFCPVECVGSGRTISTRCWRNITNWNILIPQRRGFSVQWEDVTRRSWAAPVFILTSTLSTERLSSSARTAREVSRLGPGWVITGRGGILTHGASSARSAGKVWPMLSTGSLTWECTDPATCVENVTRSFSTNEIEAAISSWSQVQVCRTCMYQATCSTRKAAPM